MAVNAHDDDEGVSGSSPRGLHPAARPWIYATAGGLSGAAVGVLDGWLAAHRTGLDPLTGAETTAAIALTAGLGAVTGLVAGAILGVILFGVDRVVPLTRLKQRLSTRRARLVMAALAVLFVGAVVVWGTVRNIEWDAIDYRIPGLLLAGLVGTIGGALLQRRGAAQIAAAAALAVVFVAAPVTWSSTGDARDEGLVRVGTETALSRHVLLAARTRLFDGDGDQYPTALCRLDCDCDDANAEIYPGATEIPANDIDEDCNGSDLTREQMARFDALLAADETEPTAPAPDPGAAGTTPDTPTVETPEPPGLKLTRPGPPDIIFITIDTLRADHLGYEGYARATSPTLDRLAGEGVVFRQARATGPQTRFSVPSMLTSKYFTEIRRTPGDWPRIHADETLIAELLDARGYHTASWHSVTYFAPLYGMDQGFDHYDDSPLRERHPWQRSATSDLVTDKALAYVDSEAFQASRAAGEPYYFWVYYGDPHSSYLFHEGFERFGPSRTDAYDAEILFTDHHIGRLLDGMRERGLLDNTVVVITSDHGEGLHEAEDHGHKFHGPVLYDEAMRVPLIVTGPGLEPREVTTPVSLIDLAPTLADLAGVEPFAEHRGLSLRPWLEGEDPGHPPVFFEKHKEDALPQKGMVKWPYKVILVLPYNRLRIYDLEADPREQTDLAKKLPEAEREELVGLLNYWSGQVLEPVEAKSFK